MNVIYVDENDEVIGSGPLSGAIKKGIIVRVARVFLRNREGKLLIQKRSDDFDSLPGRWDQSAAGHVDEGEEYLEAALRELNEEMGITGVEIEEVAKYYTEENDEAIVKKRFNMLYVGYYDGEVRIDNDEVSDYKWVEADELRKKMNDTPDKYTEGFIKAFEVFNNKK